MAKLFFCNNGDIELKAATIGMLRAMPRAWSVFLNSRPANQGTSERELDALVVTGNALHLIEFKYRTRPVEIRGEGAWIAGGYHMENGFRKESPQEQVIRTHDAFKDWLETRSYPPIKLHPWVVLENGNPHNVYGNARFQKNAVEQSGIVWILNGPDTLARRIQERERTYGRGDSERPTPELTQRLAHHLGAQTLDTMVLQGSVLSLDSGQPIPNVTANVFTQGAEPMATPTTDNEGRFEVPDLPVARFRVELDLPPEAGWRAVPVIEYTARPGFVPVRIFLANPGLTEAEVRALLSRELARFEQELTALHNEMVDAYHGLETKLDAATQQLATHEELLLELLERPNAPANVVDMVKSEVAKYHQERRHLEALALTDVASLVENAATPLRTELSALEARVVAAERHADQAARQAATAAQHATRATAYHEARAQVEQQQYRDRQVQAEQQRLNRERMAEALKWSAIVGGAGGIISMQPIPFADNVILTPMQIGLVMHIGRIYGREFTSDLAFKLLGPLGLGFLAQHGTVLLYKLIPGAWGLGAMTVPAYTVALGWAAARYFEQGNAPTRAEQVQVFRRAVSALRDPEVFQQFKQMGATLVTEIKARHYRVSGEEINDILATIRSGAGDLGERLRDLLAPRRETPPDTPPAASDRE